ncbi:hypothetical protein MCEMRE26_01031 [Candidatus Nanopelagicaceae bacterium]
MNILKRYESDDFDESYDFDEPENGEFEETGSSKPFLVKALIMIMTVTGIAYGANIALNGGSGGNALEFGQGQVSTNLTCDTNGGITVIPYAGYVNEAASTGKFTLDSIIFENVDDTCEGKDFTVQVWSNAGANALTSSETKSAGNYITSDSVRFWFADSATVTMMSNQYTDIELLTDVESSEFANDQSSFQLTFDPDQTSSFANATEVYKITVTTSPHTS